MPFVHMLPVALTCTVSVPAIPPSSARVEPAGVYALLGRGLEYGYNLDYPEALAAFERAIDIDPENATAHRLAAAAIWMRMLLLQGAVTVEDYLGQAKTTGARKVPPVELAAQFDQHVDRALALAERRVRTSPRDPDAHFQLGAAAALRTSFIAVIQGSLIDSLGTGRRAYGAHKRALSLDRRRHDAALVVGMYRYTVANLSMPMRVMARIAGFEGGQGEGIRLIEEAAAHPSYAQVNAMLTLVVIYNREGRHDAALRVIGELQRRFPRNRLLWLEEASTRLRAGRPREALEALDVGHAMFQNDQRPKAFGEAAHWRMQRGAALLALGEHQQGRGELQAVTVADAPAWLRDRARRLLAGTRG